MWATMATALLLAVPVQAAQSGPSADVWIARADRETATVVIAIMNTDDKTICADRRYFVPRAFRLFRNGTFVDWAPGIPFVSVRDRCVEIEPGATYELESRIDLAYPDRRRDDRLCFTAYLGFKDETEGNTLTTVCRLLD